MSTPISEPIKSDRKQPSAAPVTTNYTSDSPDHGTDETEDDAFDIIASRVIPIEPMLESEPFESPMLRGLRKYNAIRPRSSSHPRRLSVTASVVTEEGTEPDVETPLLKGAIRATSDSASTSSTTSDNANANSPFLGGVTVARFWIIFLEITATYFIACFDGTIMASSHPVITSYFGASNSASWLSTAFLLTSTTLQPLLARYSDSVGRKGPYVFTMAVFLGATVWCGLAQSITSLIIARAACGFGAGGMMSVGGIIVGDLVPIE